jgi:hypothetical protein
MDSNEAVEEVLDLIQEYLSHKKDRDAHQDVMNVISVRAKELMEEFNLGSVKEGLGGVSMSNGAKMSMDTLKKKLLEVGVPAAKIAEAVEKSKPTPKYSPRFNTLKKKAPLTVVQGRFDQ